MKNPIWFKHYDKGIPYTLMPYPELTLVDAMRESASQRPNQPALLFQGNVISHRELENLSISCANALIQLGVKPGERVALMLPNTPQMILSIFGIWMAGAIVVPLNPLYTERELEHAFHECGAETVIVLTPFYQKMKAVQPRTAIRNIIAVNIKEFLPPFKKILFTLLKEKKGRSSHRVASGRFLVDRLVKP